MRLGRRRMLPHSVAPTGSTPLACAEARIAAPATLFYSAAPLLCSNMAGARIDAGTGGDDVCAS